MGAPFDVFAFANDVSKGVGGWPKVPPMLL